MGNTAIYARVSSDEQANNYSLPSQVALCREKAAKLGWQIVGEPFLDDYTGTALDRPALNELRELARSGAIEHVLCLELDRLGRGLAVPLVIEGELKRMGAPVTYVQEDYEDTADGTLKKGIRATLSEYERLKIIERTKRGRKAKKDSGSLIVGAVTKYGYTTLKDEKKRFTEYRIVDCEAATVVNMFNWCAVGDETGKRLKTADIARRLSAAQIPTRLDTLGGKFAARKKARPGSWSKRQVLKILRDPIYKGQTSIPAIIPPDLWQAVQDQIDSNKVTNKRRNTRNEYLMRSRLKCVKCGKTMQYMVDSRSGLGYYYCNGTKRCDSVNQEKICSGIYPQAKVDDLIWDKLAELLKNPDLIIATYQQNHDEMEAQNAPIRLRLDVVRTDLAAARQTREETLDLYLNHDIPREMLDRRMTDLKQSIAAYEKEERQLAAQIAQVEIDDSKIERLMELCAGIADDLDILDFEGRQYWIELLDLRGMVQRDGREYVIEMSGILPEPVSVSGTIKGQSGYQLPLKFSALVHGFIKP